MFTKNYLTRIQNNLLIEAAVVSVKPARLAETMSTILNCIGKSPLILADRWVFRVFKKSNLNSYELTTKNRQQKTSLGKLVNKKLRNGQKKNFIKQIISNILGFVKEKFVIPKFAKNKLKSPVFSN